MIQDRPKTGAFGPLPASAAAWGPATLSEKIVVVLILVFPCMGTFFAPESYFAPQDFSLEAALHPVEVGLPLGRIAFALIPAWLAPLYWRAPRIMLAASLRSLIPIALVLWMLISASWTGDPSASINRTGRMFILILFSLYLIERFETDDLVRLITIAGAIAILASIAAIIALPAYGYSSLNGYEGAWRGATSHKNALGALMTILFLFGYYSQHTRKNDWRLSWFVMFGSLFLAVMSRSATSLVVFLVTFALISGVGLLNAFRTQNEKILTAIIFLILLSVAYLLHEKLDELLLLLGRDPSFTGRKEVWESVSALIEQRPILGFGHVFWAIDSLERDGLWAELGWAAPHAHSMFLDIRLQLGIVGVAITVILFTVSFWRIIRLISRTAPISSLIWPLLLITTLFRGLSETYLVDPGLSGLFWCTLAYAALARSIETNSRGATYAHHGNSRPRHGRILSGHHGRPLLR